MRFRFGLLLLTAASVGLGCSSEEPTSVGAPPADIAGRLERDTGVPWAVAQDPDFGTASFLEPVDEASPVLAPGADPVEAALAFIEEYKDVFGLVDLASELTLEETGVDDLELTYVAFLQRAHGLPVHGNRLTVQFEPSGAVAFVSGRVAPNAGSVDPSPSLSEATAGGLARGELAALHPSVDAASVTTEAAELVIVATDAAHARLGWQVEVTSSSSGVAYRILVDAGDGSVLGTESLVQAGDASGSGRGGRYYIGGALHDAKDVKSFVVTELVVFGHSFGYVLSRPETKKRTALKGHPWSSDGKLSLYSSASASRWDVEGAGQAVDAYYHLALVDQYYRKVHNRKSYDDKNGNLAFIAHDPAAVDNAFWTGEEKRIHFGDRSNDKVLSASADLDVCAHELQHGVTENTVKLVYAFQSGAMNESLSDIFGCFVEHHVRPGPKNFTIGDNWDGAGAPMRSMADPASLGYPAHMSDYLKAKADEDAGGVHTNSSIPNHAWYLMTMGGRHRTSGITVGSPLGWQRSGQLWYAAIKSKSFAMKASFAAVARATVGKAKSLKGGTKQERRKTVACAWVAVGVLDAAEVEKQWKVTCGGGAGISGGGSGETGGAPTGGDPGATPDGKGSCFDGTITCGAGQICSWNGNASGYCCKEPWVGDHICFADQECAPGVCGLGADKKFYCTMPDAVACETP